MTMGKVIRNTNRQDEQKPAKSQNPTNTLFRFVTMRAPELSDEKSKSKRFVFRNHKNYSSSFDQAVKSRSSELTCWQAMQVLAETFTPLTEESIKINVDSNLLEFAIWVSRNKHSFSTKNMLEKMADLSNLVSPETLTLLWDNLFYQVVTQKDFYVKETIMQLLIANHIQANEQSIDSEYQNAMLSESKNTILETELIKNIVNAKIVLPKELFDEKEATVSLASRISSKGEGTTTEEPLFSVVGDDMRLFVETNEAKEKLEKHLKLKKELQKIEKEYKKEYQEAYQDEYERHLEIIEPILEKYSQEIELNKTRWCEIRNSEIKYDVNDPCNQPPAVLQPKLPKFNFKFRDELDLIYLGRQLSEENFGTLLDILEIEPEEEDDFFDDEKFAKSSEELLKDGNKYRSPVANTFEETFSLIQDEISFNSQTIINNTTSQSTASVSLGGVVFPIINPKVVIPFAYQICSKKYSVRSFLISKNYVDFDMTLDLPDNTWQITNVKTEVLANSSTSTSNVFNQLRTGNTVKLSNLFNEKKLPYGIFLSGINDLTITISFSNGAVKSFSSRFWNTISCLSGTLVSVKDAPTLPVNSGSDGTGSSNPPVVEDNFVPSGFGVKQLGIADYKKVEQTVQGYVEGDVAHIENVMAREYKEKVTRKLLRSENTTSVSTETEKEQLSDTTSTDRYEMQNEVAKVLQEGKDFSTGASFSATWKSGAQYSLGANVNLATHSSKEESNRHAITNAKDVTERAMERIVSKVKEERITKIVEEFEENNKHGFDNTRGDKHVVGVFRWVDKVYKNQVLNFGKRLMFEFMVPEPAKLHLLGMSENKEATSLIKPSDPRKFEDPSGAIIPLKVSDYTKINDNTVKYWGGVFNVELKPMPDNTISISHSFQDRTLGIDDNGYGRWTGAYFNNDFKVPERYHATYVKGKILYSRGVTFSGNMSASSDILICGKSVSNGNVDTSLSKITDKITVSAISWDVKAISGSLVATCELTPEAKTQWQQETFKAIINAYEAALTEYNQKLVAENAIGIKIKGENPGFYRQIENTILRKNCISYIIDQNENAKRTYGKNMFKSLSNGIERKFRNYEVNVGPALDDYAAFSKFIEQAFEWEIMSYNFYPYYWGAKEDWSSLYQYDNNDPLFRSFMQSGMARVIVTVRPGFEEAVNYYMQTGQIWNGGEVPVIEDKLFMSIVDELRQIPGQKEGKAWATRLPTSLTILQAQTIGLNVIKALPFDEDLSDFENPESVPQTAGLDFSEAQLGVSQSARIVGKITGNQNREAKIILKNLDGSIRDLTYCDLNGNWELNNIPVAKYQLLLDANNDFPSTEFQVSEGSKEQTVQLSADQILEINLSLQLIV